MSFSKARHSVSTSPVSAGRGLLAGPDQTDLSKCIDQIVGLLGVTVVEAPHAESLLGATTLERHPPVGPGRLESHGAREGCSRGRGACRVTRRASRAGGAPARRRSGVLGGLGAARGRSSGRGRRRGEVVPRRIRTNPRLERPCQEHRGAGGPPVAERRGVRSGAPCLVCGSSLATVPTPGTARPPCEVSTTRLASN